MFVVVAGMSLLAVFANVQYFRRDSVERVAVRTPTSPTPQPR
jgi:hypothetical protein